MKKDLISIIVRTKNEGFWISQCLFAIEKQLYKNFEIIVLVNNSKDNTINLIRRSEWETSNQFNHSN